MSPASGRQLVDARCYECWLPHVSFQVCGATPYGIRSVLELPQCRIAAEAEYATDPTRPVVVIHMCCGGGKAYAADARLRGDESIALRFRQAVLPLQMTCPAVFRLARLAPARKAVRSTELPMPLSVRLDLSASATVLVAGRDVALAVHIEARGLPALQVILLRAFPAIGLQSISHRLITRERFSQKRPATPGAPFRRHWTVSDMAYCPPF